MTNDNTPKEPPIVIDFENRLGDVRRERGLSQTMINKATNMPISQISRHENREHPKMTLRVAYAYAKAIGCSIEELFPPTDPLPAVLVDWIENGLPNVGLEDADNDESVDD